MWGLWVAAARAFEIVDAPLDGSGFDSFSVDLGGYVQPRFRFVEGDEVANTTGEVGFSVQRVRLELRNSFHPDESDRFGFGLDQVYTIELMPEPRLQDAFVNGRLGSPLQLRLGQFKSPHHRASMASDANSLFPDRNQITTWQPDREIGAMVHGWVGPRALEWQVCAFNGEGTNRLSNVNQKLMYVGRVVVAPFGSPGADYEILRDWTPTPGKYPPIVSVGASALYNVQGPPGQRDGYTAYNVELFFHWRFLTVMSERFAKLEDYEEPAIADFEQVGQYVQAGAFLEGVPWAQDPVALMGRFEDGDRADPIDQVVPIASPLDVTQASRRFSVGAGIYAGPPLFRQVQDFRLVVSYTVREEREQLPFDDNELNVLVSFTF